MKVPQLNEVPPVGNGAQAALMWVIFILFLGLWLYLRWLKEQPKEQGLTLTARRDYKVRRGETAFVIIKAVRDGESWYCSLLKSDALNPNVAGELIELFGSNTQVMQSLAYHFLNDDNELIIEVQTSVKEREYRGSH